MAVHILRSVFISQEQMRDKEQKLLSQKMINSFLVNLFDPLFTYVVHMLKMATGADAIKKFTPGLGIPNYVVSTPR
jgi:hypothetical protein